jgi:hypothetical protein
MLPKICFILSRLRRLGPVALALLLATGTVQCGGGEKVGPPPVPSAIEIAGGDGQVASVNDALPDPLVVKVIDEAGDPVEGVIVQWDAHGTGDVSPATVVTGADGRASVSRWLGDTPGQQTTTASVAGLQGSPVTFTATATDGLTPTLAITTQPSLTTRSGAVLAAQPVIQLKDGAGADLAERGVTVTVALAGTAGTLAGGLTAITGDAGSASFTDLAVTGDPGDYTVRFSASGYAPATSSAIALEAAPTTIALTNNPPTAALSGEVFDPDAQPEVQVKDGSGQPAAGVEVTASIASGGTLEGTRTATTDASGFARFGDLGIRTTGPSSEQTLRFAIPSDTVTAAPTTVSPLSSEATTGKWGPVVSWDIVPLHLSLLPSGSLLGWGKLEPNGEMGMPRLWDPSSGSPSGARMIAVDTMLFCAGHALMSDGRLMISGGHKADGEGLDITTIFDPVGESFIQSLPKMAHGRWYPTVTELPDGRMLTMAGQDSAGHVVTIPEIWEGNEWVELPGAGALQIPYYPRNFIDPTNGWIFMSAERVRSRWFDPDGVGVGGGRGRWISGPTHIWDKNRDYGSAVMYETGKILVVGGGGDPDWSTPDAKASAPTATAERIDLTAGSPAWQSAGSMSSPRRHVNATVLPDGKVLVTGGTSGGGFDDFSAGSSTREAELWNPATPESWTTLAAGSVVRTYHSVSLLLPDGTVLHGASGDAIVDNAPKPDARSHEIFSPPYLFKGARPTIASVTPSVGYGQTFTVTTPNAAQITEVRWIRIGSVTHAFDFGQQAATLEFTRTATGVSVTAPASSRDATPGHYMLFLLNRNDVPSKGKIVRIH